MQTNFHLKEFNGPLDVLLSLINEEKMDINEVSLSHVTEQYLNYLRTIEDKRPEELADFLVVAARLLFLKSRNLLSQLSLEEEEGPSLADQLRVYQAFLKASREIDKKWNGEVKSFFRRQPLKRLSEFIPPTNLHSAKLSDIMLKLINRLKPLPEFPQSKIDKGISLKEKAEQIKNLFQRLRIVSFYELLNNVKSRTEMIVTFLALLELMKQELIVLKQKNAFNEISVEKI